MDTIRPDWANALGLPLDRMPSLEEMQKAYEKCSSDLSTYRQIHKYLYSMEMGPSEPLYGDIDKLNERLKTKSPEYIRIFKISQAQLDYLTTLTSDALDLVGFIEAYERDNDQELKDRNSIVKTVSNMVPMATPLEDFLTQVTRKVGYGDTSDCHSPQADSAKALLDSLPTLKAEELERLNDLFETPIETNTEEQK